MLPLCLLVAVVISAGSSHSDENLRTDENSERKIDSAAAEAFLRARVMDRKYLHSFGQTNGFPVRKVENFHDTLPENFDAREKWPECPSIGYIRDQSNCVSAWAMVSAGVIGDRACIQSKGRIKKHISDTDILACCQKDYCSGCEGGYPAAAFEYAVESGVCSGEHYREKNVCKPYSYHPCGYLRGKPYYGECPQETYPTPRCRRKCQIGYNVTYEADKIHGKSVYYLPNNETEIRREIMTNGPVAAVFIVYMDLWEYDKGVYEHKTGMEVGEHVVKIIGWGTDEKEKVPYWLVANSWNDVWGEKGFFRIIRGHNHCEIESEIAAVILDV
ncbi:unnamed protein product [Cylicocyclus nassatus]|uniref:Peptidase C1A papain C-terminal domain-containing protein n=1 Tax=Cylicocyclus nassatus TaxID=53992 RepID=A0AA36M0M9_CYLNA|nr:unnamed protein product [Cylicocyclus nassatus]